jgi:HSP20 family protein
MQSRHDPLREALSLRRVMDELFEQSFVNPRWARGGQSQMMPIDVHENDQGYRVRIALPGVKPEDIDVTLNQNTLAVRGHVQYGTSEQPQGQQEAGQERQQGNWLMREIGYGTFERSITFDRPIDPDHIQTEYEHGILTMKLPVSEASRPRRINVVSGQTQPQQINVESGAGTSPR